MKPDKNVDAELRAAIEARRELRRAELPPALEKRIWQSLRSHGDEPPAWASVRWRMGAAWQRWKRRPLAWGLSAGALATAAVLTVIIVRPQLGDQTTHSSTLVARAEMVTPDGELFVVRAGSSQRERVDTSAPVAVGDRLETGARGHARVTQPSLDMVALDATTLTVRALAPTDTRWQVGRGVVGLKVRPNPTQRVHLRIELPQATVHVVGTVFWVTTEPGRDEVSVWQGKVRVELTGGESIDVADGERLALVRGLPERGPLDEARSAEIMAALGLAPSQPTAATEPTRPQRDKRTRVTPQRPGPSAPELLDVERLALEGDCAAAHKQAQALSTKVPSFVRAQALVLVADCHFGAGDSAQALTLYRRTADQYGSTAAGQNAAYELGRIARDQGRPDDALMAFSAYLRRYPRGTLAPEALYRSCLLHMDAARHNESLACLARYRRIYPKGQRLAESWLVEATIERTGKRDCTRAMTAYDRYLALSGPLADEARSWRAWCDKQISGK